MRSTARFPAVRESVVKARQFVTDTIPDVPRDVSDTLLVIASELATNCVRHGASSFEIRLEQLPDRILIEAEDDVGGEPVVRSPTPYDTSGRGLQIVKALSDNWGVVRRPESTGKTVWAVLSVPAAALEQATATDELKSPVTPAPASPVNPISRAVQALFLRLAPSCTAS
jgi:two-component sensor histidine kinase